MSRGLTLKMGRFHREMKKRGLPDAAAVARNVGLHKSTVWRVMNGHARPGPEFVNALLAAWDLEFHDIFEDPRRARTRRVA